jgi:hypothetical protein
MSLAFFTLEQDLHFVLCDSVAPVRRMLRDVARREEQGLTAGTRVFVEAHIDPTDEQQTLPLWQ